MVVPKTNPKAGLSRFLRQLKTDDWITPVIDKVSDFESKERWAEPNLELHPSGAGSPCALDIQYGLLGHRTPMKVQNKRRAMNGTMAHQRWTNELKNTGLLHSAGERLKIIGEWSGEYDVMLQNPVTGRLHLGEIKTMNLMRFNKQPSQVEDLELMAQLMFRSEPSYVYQLTQYLVMFQKQNPLISDDVFFLFEDTNTQNYKIIMFRPPPAMREAAFTNGRKAQEASRRGELLAPPFKKGSPTCRSCYREAMCYQVQSGDPPDHRRAAMAALAKVTGQVPETEFSKPAVAESAEITPIDDEDLEW